MLKLRFLYIGMLFITTCNYGFEDLTKREWDTLRNVGTPVSTPIVKQKSWITTHITGPLKRMVRETLKPEAEFLTQEVQTREPQIEADKALYSNVRIVRKNSPEHLAWQEAVAKNPSYGAQNPIVFSRNVEQRWLDKNYQERVRDVHWQEMQLYNEKLALEKGLKKRNWLNPMEKERDRLAVINMELSELDNELTYDLPMHWAMTRQQQQEVRKNRLEQLKKDIEHPTHRFINNTAFAREFVRHGNWPEANYERRPNEMIEYWKGKIHHADQSGLKHLHENLDEELGQKVYHASERLRNELAEGALQPEDAQLSRTIYNMSRARMRENLGVDPVWDAELARLEAKVQKRAGVKNPKVSNSWIAQAIEERKRYTSLR